MGFIYPGQGGTKQRPPVCCQTGGRVGLFFIFGLFQGTGAPRLRVLTSAGQDALAAQEEKQAQHRYHDDNEHDIAHGDILLVFPSPLPRAASDADGLETAVGVDDVARDGGT